MQTEKAHKKNDCGTDDDNGKDPSNTAGDDHFARCTPASHPMSSLEFSKSVIEESEDGWLDLSSNLSMRPEVAMDGSSSTLAGLRKSNEGSSAFLRRSATTDHKLMAHATAAELYLAGLLSDDEDDDDECDEVEARRVTDAEKRDDSKRRSRRDSKRRHSGRARSA